MPPAVEAQSPNHWTAREFPHSLFSCLDPMGHSSLSSHVPSYRKPSLISLPRVKQVPFLGYPSKGLTSLPAIPPSQPWPLWVCLPVGL